VLLPLWYVEGARRVREDVRDAEVCFALVGNVLRDSEEQGDEGCVEGWAAIPSAGAGGAGGGGWGGGGRVAVGKTWFVIRVRCTERKISRKNWQLLGDDCKGFASEILRFAQDDIVFVRSA
jgi:hypothetical protein